jgi:hypothetical protein
MSQIIHFLTWLTTGRKTSVSWCFHKFLGLLAFLAVEKCESKRTHVDITRVLCLEPERFRPSTLGLDILFTSFRVTRPSAQDLHRRCPYGLSRELRNRVLLPESFAWIRLVSRLAPSVLLNIVATSLAPPTTVRVPRVDGARVPRADGVHAASTPVRRSSRATKMLREDVRAGVVAGSKRLKS